MALKLITAPASMPVTLAEVKVHLAVDFSDHDDLLGRLIGAATRHLDGPKGILTRALIDQTWELTLDQFPVMEIKIPLAPLIEVVSVKYDDVAGIERTVDPSAYRVDAVSEPGWVVPYSGSPWPSTLSAINTVRIRFRAGYLDGGSPPSANVPDDIKTAIQEHVATLYDFRESILTDGHIPQMLPQGYDDLIRNYREWAF